MQPNDPVVGSVVLRRPAIQSPNYVPGSQGWAINADGTAEFHAISIPGGTGTGMSAYFGAAPPASPNVGDLWYDTSNGLLVHQWSGSAWVAYQIGTGAIAPGAVTNVNLAGAVTARSIGGITTWITPAGPTTGNVTGDLWINSTTGQIFQWNGAAWQAVTFNAGTVLQAGSITAYQIMANTITGAQLAAGIVYAGIVDATTIMGAQFIAYGSTGEVLVYSSFPGTGNLVNSISAAAGADSHTNAYYAGMASYGPYAAPLGIPVAVLSAAGLQVGYESQLNAGNQAVIDLPNYLGGLVFSSGTDNSGTDSSATLALQSQNASGQSGGQLLMATGQLSVPAGGGPFIQGESFHPFSGAAGLSGTFRVKQVPWNGVWMDFNGAISSTATSFNMGSLPSAAYYPAVARRLPVACTSGATAWLFIPTSGGLQLLLSAASNGATVSMSTVYPVN